MYEVTDTARGAALIYLGKISVVPDKTKDFILFNIFSLYSVSGIIFSVAFSCLSHKWFEMLHEEQVFKKLTDSACGNLEHHTYSSVYL